jgi:hypothetical protein
MTFAGLNVSRSCGRRDAHEKAASPDAQRLGSRDECSGMPLEQLGVGGYGPAPLPEIRHAINERQGQGGALWFGKRKDSAGHDKASSLVATNARTTPRV